MARRSRSSAYHSSIAKRSLLLPLARRLPDLVLSLDDRRTYHPNLSFRSVGALTRFAKTIRVSPRFKGVAGYGLRGGDVFGFRVPEKVSICVRRKQRREVMFAMARTGKGSRSYRRRNEWSDVKC